MVDRSQETQAEIADFFIKRWSPRSFDPDFELSKSQLNSLFEAARWAPSSFNDQPWNFLIAPKGSSHFKGFLSLLDEGNQVWARNASLLGFVICRKEFSTRKKLNTSAEFDCGSAWMSMSLQALKMDLYCHGMAGFDDQKAYLDLGVDLISHKIICAFAIGKKGNKANLPEKLQNMEEPNTRKPLEEIYWEGGWKSQLN